MKAKEYVLRLTKRFYRVLPNHYFVTTIDFDTLYTFFERRIPMSVIIEALNNYTQRRNLKKIAGIKWEVERVFCTFLQLSVGRHDNDNPEPEPATIDNHFEQFFNKFPLQLEPLKHDFQELYRKIKAGGRVSLKSLEYKLLNLFKKDEDLNLKVKIFNRDLAPELRTPAMENRYRLNYIYNRFRVPDFTLLEFER